MLDIVVDSVKRLEEIIKRSGCEEGDVRLDVNPDVELCQYERGACMVAFFGGRSAEFVTDDPVRALTKISFLEGAPLDTPTARSAACAIINVAAGFFCLSRVLHSCPRSDHTACYSQLKEELAGHTVFCIGTFPSSAGPLGTLTDDPKNADTILINGEGIIAMKTDDTVDSLKDTKRIICLGPSTAGVARLQQLEHWCPYGRSCL